ncbi:MAG: hypothetical protein ACOCWR_10500 [Oceanidesulfovibrio sp.]
MNRLPEWAGILWFVAGGAAVMLLDRLLAKFDTTASQLVAMRISFRKPSPWVRPWPLAIP